MALLRKEIVALVPRKVRCECFSDVELVAVQLANGDRHYRPRCGVCSRTLMYNIGHRRLTEHERQTATVIKDNNRKMLCERCGADDGTELHHWAPREYFEDADDWPQSYLCPSCHSRWHEIINSGIALRQRPF